MRDALKPVKVKDDHATSNEFASVAADLAAVSPSGSHISHVALSGLRHK